MGSWAVTCDDQTENELWEVLKYNQYIFLGVDHRHCAKVETVVPIGGTVVPIGGTKPSSQSTMA